MTCQCYKWHQREMCFHCFHWAPKLVGSLWIGYQAVSLCLSYYHRWWRLSFSSEDFSSSHLSTEPASSPFSIHSPFSFCLPFSRSFVFFSFPGCPSVRHASPRTWNSLVFFSFRLEDGFWLNMTWLPVLTLRFEPKSLRYYSRVSGGHELFDARLG